MLTRCPSCQTTFKVTSDILRVAEGQVRCGRCQYQFNALLYLQHPPGESAPRPDTRDDRDLDETPSIASRLVQSPRAAMPPAEDDFRPPLRRQSQPPPQEDDLDEFSLPDIEDEPVDLHDDADLHSVDDPDQWPAEPASAQADDWAEPDPQQEAADWPAHDDAQDEDPWPTRSADNALGTTRPQRQVPPWATAQQPPPRSAAAQDIDEQQLIDRVIADTIAEEDALLQAQAEEIIAERRQRTAALREPPQPQAPELDDEFDLLTQPRQGSSLVWKLLALPLLLLVVVQVVHNYRATLARHPQIGEPLQQVYASLGMTLRPDWDLHAYEVRQWGVIADPATPGTLVVRASIKNLASYAQPYPQLKLMLEDRWGEQVRARAFEPAEYLDAMAAPERLLLPGQQANATIAIVDPGPDAEGFRFDVCLRGAHGVVCAADLPRR